MLLWSSYPFVPWFNSNRGGEDNRASSQILQKLAYPRVAIMMVGGSRQDGGKAWPYWWHPVHVTILSFPRGAWCMWMYTDLQVRGSLGQPGPDRGELKWDATWAIAETVSLLLLQSLAIRYDLVTEEPMLSLRKTRSFESWASLSVL